MSQPKPKEKKEAPQLKAVSQEETPVDVAKLTQILNNALKLMNALQIQASQDYITLEVKQSITYVNNELVKVQNALASETSE